MKTITKMITIAALMGAGISTLSAGEKTGEEIFNATCTACHATSHPKDESKMIAPPIMGAVKHVKMTYEDKDAAVLFIADYIRNPSHDKAIFGEHAIDKFGVMPSQKSTLSEEDSLKVAEYVYDDFGKSGHGDKGHKNKENCDKGHQGKGGNMGGN